MLEVVRISTLVCCLILSISVRRAFTTLTASLHSKPEPEFFLAAVRTHTKVLGLFTWLLISSNIFCSSFPDSENHLEKRLCELICTRTPSPM